MVKNWQRSARDLAPILAKDRGALLIWGAIVAFLIIFPLVESLNLGFSRLLRTDSITLLIYTLLFVSLTQSWNLLGGYAGQINLGHAASFGLGALLGRKLWLIGVPFPFAILSGGLTALLFALAIGGPAFRLRGVYFIIGTLAVAEILSVIVGNVYSETFSPPVAAIQDYDVVPRYYVFLLLAVLTVATVYVISKLRLGMGLTAVRENEDAAEAAGVNTFKHKMVAFGLSAFLAGLAGGAYAFYDLGFVYLNFGFSPLWTFDTVIIVFVGGIGTIIGPILGAVFFVVFARVLAVTWPGEVHLLVFGGLFLLVVFFFPGGLVELVRRVRRLLWPAKKEESKQA